MYSLVLPSASRKLGPLVLTCLIAFVTACTSPSDITPDQTGLTGPSYHTGTLTILRVDDAWHSDPAKRQHYKIGSGLHQKRGRLVPLRGKTDIAGTDGPDRIVTKDDLVTITLNSAFIKYFKESRTGTASGEIAVVLSFSAGSTVKESLLIHSSRGQTLGSFLDLQDWPVAGPVQIDGDSLLVRIVVIELDGPENENRRQTVRALAGIGTTLNPGLGPIFSITQQIADFVISQNSDDVIFDQKFSLQRVDSSLPATRSALLYGKYVLLMQEDKLANPDLQRTVPLSNLPPKVDSMRYDTEFDRVAKVYNYFPHPQLTDEDCKDNKDLDVQKNYRPTFRGVIYEGVGRIDYDLFYPQKSDDPLQLEADDLACVLKKLVNGKVAKSLRSSELGYRDRVVGELELQPSLDEALKLAFLDGIRHFPTAPGELVRFNEQLEEWYGYRPAGEVAPFNYPVTQYPEAYTLVAQYPLHTHLVLSIDRSLGADGQKFHDGFQTFVDFMNKELQSARDNDRVGALATALDQTIRARRVQQALLRKVDRLNKEAGESTEQFHQRRVCRLWQDGLRASNDAEAPNTPLSDAPIYNEIFHITGHSFSNRDEVAAYLEKNSWTLSRDNHTCTPPATGDTPNASAGS